MSRAKSSALHALAAVVLALAVLVGCGGTDAPPVSDIADELSEDVEQTASGPSFIATDNPALLSEWGQLASREGHLVLGDGVTPFTLNSSLFSDHAQKLRTVWLPDGAPAAGYEPTDVFNFPVGTVITKTFYYLLAEGDVAADLRVTTTEAPPQHLRAPLDLSTVRLIETRVLAHRETGWIALPYVWNDEQTEAELQRTGDLVRLTLIDDGDELPLPYLVPNVNQCAGCHATNHTTKLILPIGPKARHLNTDVDLGEGSNPQLTQWINLGLVAGVPDLSEVPKAAVWSDDTAPLNDRARSYLDINCAHCHNSNGPADTSGLFLEASTELGAQLGVCKPPVAAGTGTGNRTVGISPGEPDESIFIFRMQSADPGAMMPELGRAVIHEDGVELISEWIASLDGSCS